MSLRLDSSECRRERRQQPTLGSRRDVGIETGHALEVLDKRSTDQRTITSKNAFGIVERVHELETPPARILGCARKTRRDNGIVPVEDVELANGATVGNTLFKVKPAHTPRTAMASATENGGDEFRCHGFTGY
jgi:hypothetical protein